MYFFVLSYLSLICSCSILFCNGYLTNDFQKWLKTKNDFKDMDFTRKDIDGGSFGGKKNSNEKVVRRPVVFVHGNGDRAIDGPLQGWKISRNYFLKQGYKDCELYATTWGPANINQAILQTHNWDYVNRIRKFLFAVLEYTGQAQIDVITHSMGVTLSRKAILGGILDGKNLGLPLTNKIKTFIGIAGGNYGLTNCFTIGSLAPTCNSMDGFYPGVYSIITQKVTLRSKLLQEMLDTSGFEGERRIAIWTPTDEVLKYGCIVYGTITCRFPGMTAEHVIENSRHIKVKDDNSELMYTLISK